MPPLPISFRISYAPRRVPGLRATLGSLKCADYTERPMGWTIHLGKGGPAVRRSMTCESCGQPFACEVALGGCWCSEIRLSEATRSMLREKFADCLCRDCLTKYKAAED